MTEDPLVQKRHSRVVAVDVVRGIAMALMVLDHARDFLHVEAFRFDPTDLAETTAPTFLTRWVTHIVAPIFVLLAGVSARLQILAGRSHTDLARFLLIRGLWLIVLEFTVVRAGTWFNVDPAFLGLLQVIWVLGVGMMVLAGLAFLPDALILLIAGLMVVGHNAFDDVRPAEDLTALWAILHERANLTIGSATEPNLIVLYPLLPWVGVVALGFVLGRVYSLEIGERRRLLIGVGAALTFGWAALRASNLYGDPRPFQPTLDLELSVLSFLNAEKYPPSLIFLSMTLGPALMLLGAIDGRRLPRPTAWLAILGRVPLFFYVLQWFAVHALAVAMEAAAGRDVAWHFMAPPERFSHVPNDAGFPLPVVYLAWIAVLFLLYEPSRRYAELRARRGGLYQYL